MKRESEVWNFTMFILYALRISKKKFEEERAGCFTLIYLLGAL